MQAPEPVIFHQEKEISLDDNDDDFLPETETPAALAPSQPVIFHEGRIFERFLHKVTRNLYVVTCVGLQYLYIIYAFFSEKEISLDDDDDEPQYEEEKLQVNIYFLTHLRS